MYSVSISIMEREEQFVGKFYSYSYKHFLFDFDNQQVFAKFLKDAPPNINQNHFYVNYGNEQSGILYGEIWLGSQVLIMDQ